MSSIDSIQCSCGATNSVIEEDYKYICAECGLVLGGNYMSSVGGPSQQEGSTWYKFKHEAPKTLHYKVFHHLYYVTSIGVNSPKEIIEQGSILLPQVWKKFKRCSSNSKEKVVLSFVYLLHVQNNLSIPLKTFLCKQHVHPNGVIKYVKMLQVLFDFKSAICIQNEDEFKGFIVELVQNMFHHSNPKLVKDTEVLANNIALIIHKKQWINHRSKIYVQVVSTCSAVIAGRSVVMEYTGKGRRGKRKTFNHKCINVDKVLKSCGVNPRSMQNYIKTVLEHFFEIAKKMPWKPTHVGTYSDVPYIIEEIVRYCDVETDCFDVVDNEELSTPRNISPVRSVFTKALVKFLELQKDKFNDRFCLSSFCSYFTDNYFKELVLASRIIENSDNMKSEPVNDKPKDIKTKTELYLEFEFTNDDKSDDDAKLDVKFSSTNQFNDAINTDDFQEAGVSNFDNDIIEVKKDCLVINDTEISYYHILLVKDLLRSGCSSAEIEKENYIDLVKKYLDPMASENNADKQELIDSFKDDDVSSYLCTAKEIKAKKKLIKNK